MNTYYKTILTILFLGLFILTCKEQIEEVEEEEIPAFDFRTDLVGSYIVLCTEQQFHPNLGPGTSYPLDTTEMDKTIEVSFDPDNLLFNNVIGFIKVDGNELVVEKDSTEITFYKYSPGYLEPHTGRFILPDTIKYNWNEANSAQAFKNKCKGVKL